jgi:hypothetical protein
MTARPLKKVLHRFTPQLYDFLRLLTRRHRVLSRILRELGQNRLAPVVQDGPFKGMRFVRLGTSSEELPMLLGCYEAELHDPLESMLARRPGVIVNIGCGEGYYAVGIARLLPESIVYAFDSKPEALRLCARVSAINGVADRVRMARGVRPSDLAALPLGGGLLLCDCEGCEYALLDPITVPALATCDMLVELHDTTDATQPAAMLARFRSTHDITLVPFAPHFPARERIIAQLSRAEDRASAAAERMADQQWAILRTRAR